jgi:hypothetical protein
MTIYQLMRLISQLITFYIYVPDPLFPPHPPERVHVVVNEEKTMVNTLTKLTSQINQGEHRRCSTRIGSSYSSSYTCRATVKRRKHHVMFK